ncbi:alpha-ketoglutarate-dependent dioxygenase AlkB [Pelagicoccus sp. SDUM812005]|nr:alpha-ketoglutarate-dependent dioxygenase AlkB [Pelagicoccus sp. SDUM812005]
MEEQFELGIGRADAGEPRNVLPRDGESIYFGPLFAREEADAWLRYFLEEIPWKHDEAVIYGRHIVTARKVAWYGDRNFDYTYSGRTRTALVWTEELRQLKGKVEAWAGGRYNSCLLNLYQDGSQGMAWHHDDEKGLGRNSNIASLSFGAERRFDFRHKESREKVSVQLEHGSLLVMRGETQARWQHQVPKTAKVSRPRVNLTFRRMFGQ